MLEGAASNSTQSSKQAIHTLAVNGTMASPNRDHAVPMPMMSRGRADNVRIPPDRVIIEFRNTIGINSLSSWKILRRNRSMAAGSVKLSKLTSPCLARNKVLR